MLFVCWEGLRGFKDGLGREVREYGTSSRNIPLVDQKHPSLQDQDLKIGFAEICTLKRQAKLVKSGAAKELRISKWERYNIAMHGSYSV